MLHGHPQKLRVSGRRPADPPPRTTTAAAPQAMLHGHPQKLRVSGRRPADPPPGQPRLLPRKPCSTDTRRNYGSAGGDQPTPPPDNHGCCPASHAPRTPAETTGQRAATSRPPPRTTTAAAPQAMLHGHPQKLRVSGRRPADPPPGQPRLLPRKPCSTDTRRNYGSAGGDQPTPPRTTTAAAPQAMDRAFSVSMGIENVRVLGIEDVRVRALLRGGSGATGAGQRAGSEVVMRGSLSRQAIRRPLGSRGGGSPWRVRRGGASGSCCPGC